MLHGNEDGVKNEADDDPEVKERVCDQGVEPLFEPPPAAAAVPPQAGQTTWRTQYPVV